MSDPVSNEADGNVKVLWTPTCPIVTAPDLSADIGAAGAVDLSNYLTADGYVPGTDETTITDERLSTRQSFGRPGRYSESLTIRYVYRQQEAAGTDNKAFHTLVHLTPGFLMVRWGVDWEDAFAAADIVDVLTVTCGIQKKLPPETNSVLKIEQQIFITNLVAHDVAVVA